MSNGLEDETVGAIGSSHDTFGDGKHTAVTALEEGDGPQKSHFGFRGEFKRQKVHQGPYRILFAFSAFRPTARRWTIEF